MKTGPNIGVCDSGYTDSNFESQTAALHRKDVSDRGVPFTLMKIFMQN